MSQYLSISSQSPASPNEPLAVRRRIGTMAWYAATIVLVILAGWVIMGMIVPS